MLRMSLAAAAAALLVIAPAPAQAQAQAERTTIALSVDAASASSRILHTRETISVRPGSLTLLYPKWIPGEHGPTGPLIDVAGIRITAGGASVTWRRDLENMYAIHCTVPAGATSVDVAFDFLLPPDASGFSSGASSSAKLLVLSWNQVVLYPSTPRPDDITITPQLTLPGGWKFATALTAMDVHANPVHFAAKSLTMLVDSPVIAGQYLRSIDLTPASGVKHTLNLVSDNEAALAMSAEQVTAHKHLVTEANALFGAHHYDHFDFLFTLSDQVAHFGLEHHQSNDDRVAERTLIDDNLRLAEADLLPHEFVHSWNGKYRRPAGLATGDYSTPMKGDLLWVYEGLTQYLGKVLAARSSLETPDEYRGDLALLAAQLDNRPGRTWRPLQDTNDEAQLLYYTRTDYDALRRSTDYYDEGDLIWLEVDVTIRRLTSGRKSLDDFCKAFHGGKSTSPVVSSYTFDDVVATLNGVTPFDWKTFLETRLQSLSARAPLGGIEGSGWKLAYRDTPTSMHVAKMANGHFNDLTYSLGIRFSEDGTALDVLPGSPAAKAGVAPGMKVIAVNGRKYTTDLIHDALRLGKTSSAPLDLLAATGDFYNTYHVDYHGGERYPFLEREAGRADVLSAIITAVER
jgi:predicted metalloprotease with PDZ domain